MYTFLIFSLSFHSLFVRFKIYLVFKIFRLHSIVKVFYTFQDRREMIHLKLGFRSDITYKRECICQDLLLRYNATYKDVLSIKYV